MKGYKDENLVKTYELDAENKSKVLNKAVLNKGDVGDVSKDVEDGNIVKVNELDAENNNGDLNKAELIYSDVDNARKDVEDKILFDHGSMYTTY